MVAKKGLKTNCHATIGHEAMDFASTLKHVDTPMTGRKGAKENQMKAVWERERAMLYF